jgi:hypothetical protein
LNAGVDTGDVLAQEKIPVEPGDSFVTLGWKGMIRIAELEAQLLSDLESGIPLPAQGVSVPPDSQFDNPTLTELIRYRLRQQYAR